MVMTRYLTILLFLLNISYSYTIEQNGVKEGNSRLSIGIYGEKHYSQDKSGLDIKFDGGYGRFISDKSEVLLKIRDNTDLEYHIYKIDFGYSYYFLKKPIFAPYIGFELGVSGNTRVDKNRVTNEQGLYIGAHNFLTPNIALTPELGVEFTNFNTTTESYLNIYLTYFFD
jgi:hypothetical protein